MKSFKDYLAEADTPAPTAPQMPTTPGGPPPEAPKPENPPAPVSTTDVTKMDTDSLYQKYTQLSTALQSTKAATGDQGTDQTTVDPKTKQMVDTMQKQSLEAATELKKRGYSDQQLSQNAGVKETADILRLSGVKEAGPTDMTGRVNNMFGRLNNTPPSDNPEMDAIGAQQRAQIQQRMAASATKIDARRAEQEKLRLQKLAGIQPTPAATPPAGQPAAPQRAPAATQTPAATPDEYATKKTGAYQAAQQQYDTPAQAQQPAPAGRTQQPSLYDAPLDPKFDKYPNAKAEIEKARAAARQVNPNIVPRSQATSDDDW